MRRAQDSTSSFDLFLDTICNTFGGIVFIAILLAVMVQSRSVLKTDDEDEHHATASQVRHAMDELEGMAAHHERLQLSLAAIAEVAPVVDDSEYLELVELRKQLSSLMDAAMQAATDASRTLAESLESNALQRRENEAVPKDLKEARKLLAKVRADYQSLVEAKQQTLRLPRVRTSQSASVLMLVQEGSIFLAKTPSLFGQGFNNRQVSTTTSSDSGILVKPISGTGWDLATAQAQNEFRKILQNAKDNGNSITIAIWPDSFDEFAQLRDAMINENTLYQLWPQSTGEVLKVFLGGGQASVQ